MLETFIRDLILRVSAETETVTTPTLFFWEITNVSRLKLSNQISFNDDERRTQQDVGLIGE